MNAIDQRFDQPSFDTYAKMESLLIKTLNSQDKSEELKFMKKLYNDDVNISVLTAQSAAEGWWLLSNYTALSSRQLKKNRWISGLFIVIKGWYQ